MKPYHHETIEKEAQAYWETNRSFNAKEDSTRTKFYCLSMLPYPSGELHMGHVRNYTIGDVVARYQHMLGKNVLQPMSWDAFGLPAENAALKHKVAPSAWTYQNIADMRTQLKQLGYAIDWSREFATCTPEYYHWEQWLFTRLVKKGLAYRKNSVVNWDPVDNTVLANEQVIDGCGWRSGAPVERREIPQWFLKITDYAEALINDLSQLSGWPEQVRTMQENWIGRSQGLQIHFDVADSTEKLHVYTTRPDTLFGVTYLAVAPEHPIAQRASETRPDIANFLAECKHTETAEAALATMEKKGIDTGTQAIHPLTGEQIPIWVANYVLMDYGSGAVMAVPAHDERDFEFANKHGLPIKQVIRTENGEDWNAKAALTAYGTLINSSEFNGQESKQAFDAIANALIAKGHGEKQTHYRLRDWGVSRQRYWGTPIPIIYCDDCGAVPVPDKDLPVRLPENIILTEATSPLKSISEFYHTTCPECSKPATRETDTFDTFVESSWYFVRNTCSDQTQAMTDDRAKYWAPIDQYVGGIEHAVLHLLYARFIYKVMRDEGLVIGDEPFKRLLTQGMVLKDGSKMSKSLGNTVAPQHLIQKYGADTARLFIIFAAPPEQSLEWSDSGVEGAYRFLKRIWNLAHSISAIKVSEQSQKTDQQKSFRQEIHRNIKQANQDMERLQLNTVVSACMKIFNVLSEIPKEPEYADLLKEGMRDLLLLLSPIAPHITHNLWRELAYGNDIREANWPEADETALETNTFTMVIQINGKLRGSITVAADADAKTVEKMALSDSHVQRFMAGQTPKKIIVVPKKLVNIVV
ncbi:MAG: leucine--tRNA ligase [Gammaproteobacteria bacterium]|jgi:leucyl-tRNA synthetase|nr:leucine--tRNA ligase [Gammaproteobacteria bacterium]